MSTAFVRSVNLYIDDAKVGPQLKGHVKHVHLGTKSARVEKMFRKISLHSCHCKRVRIQKNSYLVENDHHVANVVAVRV